MPRQYTDLALIVTEFHLNYHRIVELEPDTIVDLLSRLDAFRRQERFERFLIACAADAKGRPGYENKCDEKTELFRNCFLAANEVKPDEIIAQGYKGKEISEQLRLKRIDAVKNIKSLSLKIV